MRVGENLPGDGCPSGKTGNPGNLIVLRGCVGGLADERGVGPTNTSQVLSQIARFIIYAASIMLKQTSAIRRCVQSAFGFLERVSSWVRQLLPARLQLVS